MSAPVIMSNCAFFHSSSIRFALIKLHTQQLSFCLFKLSTLCISLSLLYGYNFEHTLTSSVISHLHSPLHNIQLYISAPLLLISLSRMLFFLKKCTNIMIQDICSPYSQYRTSHPVTTSFSFCFTLLNLSSS